MKETHQNKQEQTSGNLAEDSVYHIRGQIAQALERSRSETSRDTSIPKKESVCKKKYQV
jgi:hypothetical protein